MGMESLRQAVAKSRTYAYRRFLPLPDGVIPYPPKLVEIKKSVSLKHTTVILF